MASRRVRSTINNEYVQPLKLALGRMPVTLCNDYNSILLSKQHRSNSAQSTNVRIGAAFDAENFDGISVIVMLERAGISLTMGQANFDLSLVSTLSDWTETFIGSFSCTVEQTRAFVSVPQSALGSLILDGSVTLAVRAQVARQRAVFRGTAFINHLGVFESLIRLRQEVDFNNITKVDD